MKASNFRRCMHLDVRPEIDQELPHPLLRLPLNHSRLSEAIVHSIISINSLQINLACVRAHVIWRQDPTFSPKNISLGWTADVQPPMPNFSWKSEKMMQKQKQELWNYPHVHVLRFTFHASRVTHHVHASRINLLWTHLAWKFQSDSR